MTSSTARAPMGKLWLWITDGPQQYGVQYMLAMAVWWRFWTWYTAVCLSGLSLYHLLGRFPDLADPAAGLFVLWAVVSEWAGERFVNTEIVT